MILLNGWLIENISVYNKRWELQICPYAPLLMDISLSLSLSLSFALHWRQYLVSTTVLV
jgi:hypothetical protein